MTFRKDIYNKLDSADKKSYARSADKPLRNVVIRKPSEDTNSPKSSTPDIQHRNVALLDLSKKLALRSKVKKKGAN